MLGGHFLEYIHYCFIINLICFIMKKFIVISIMAALFAACSKESNYSENPYSGEQRGFVLQAPQIKSSSDSTVVFKLFAGKYEYNNSASSAEYGIRNYCKPYTVGNFLDWTLGDGELAVVHGYLPVRAGVKILSRAPHKGYPEYLYTMSENGKCPFSTATLTDIRESGTYNLEFKHRLCNLFFSVNNQLKDSVTISSVKVYGLKSKGKYQEGRGWYDLESEDRVFFLNVSRSIAPMVGSFLGGNVYLCVPPQTLGEDFRVEINWFSAKDRGTWTLGLNGDLELKEGTRVLVPLETGVNTKSVGVAMVEPWNFTGEGSEVSATQDDVPINFTASIEDWVEVIL